MSPLKVIPLVCPDCGTPLAGLPHDRLFFCVPCKKALSPKNDDWVRRPLLTPKITAPAPAQVIHLPFWELKVQAQATPGNKPQEVACRLLPQYGNIWIAAFTLVRASYFGDVGLAFTEKLIRLEPLPDFPARLAVAGCTREIEEAVRYAELFITLILDKRADVTGMKISLAVQGARLWAIPFADQGNQIQDLIIGSILPAFAVDDLEHIRKLEKP
jgi:hypothetical protein